MKKFLKMTSLTLLALIVVGFVALKLMDNSNEREVQNEDSNSTETTKQENPEKSQVANEKTHEQEKALEVPENPTGKDIENIMHKMIHQKVRAERKTGAVRMTPEAIDEVIELINNVQPSNSQELLKMANHWKNGNYEHVVEEHNYFWSREGGDIGKAYGRASLMEENEFIRQNFLR
ncbi:DUF6241 domain-containing protein [Priestia endophytica]|uniref:Uncharacterized protein n=1 Tax=Priestia endophytica DSM 13796 TaxID=1121089 RepID=A0A1I6C920_9BACI|nr:DUF6241 domain-containing protein [Priestia endophytica]KYG32975.1 hypothetical protein AZF06_22855 [Priestia endophytica]SFQ89605.1 hypothetical protein SAMN02745910_05312 [Priestia endophytica DSM 13796]